MLQEIFPSVFAEKPRYAETWDFEVSGSSFLQFELSMGCSKSTSFSHGVRLEYSTDCGQHWSLITPECVPPAIGCAGYTQSSVYTSTQYKHWRRITVYLPSAAKYVTNSLLMKGPSLLNRTFIFILLNSSVPQEPAFVGSRPTLPLGPRVGCSITSYLPPVAPGCAPVTAFVIMDVVCK